MLSKTQLRRLHPLTQQKILILGGGREGLSTYKFLRRNFSQLPLAIADQNKKLKSSRLWRDIFIKDRRLSGFFGPENYLQHLLDYDLVFRTPGIQPTLPAIIQAKEKGVLFTSNTQLFLKLVRGKTIGVTGTKGKSTTSSLLSHLLQAGGKKVQLLGNIGIPALDLLEEIDGKTYTVMEMSAHQLQDLQQSPQIAVIQNITSEHLDYYKNTAAYVEAKSSIVRWQKPSDYLVYSDDFATSRAFANLSHAQKLIYGQKETPEHLAFVRGRAIFYRGPNDKLPRSLVDRKKIKLLGKHNLYNIMPAIIVAKHFLVTDEQIATALYNFTPLKHRLEYVQTIKDVSYYNDSLSTTPQASVAALQTFTDKKVILIAGGHERHQDFSHLANKIIKNQTRALILFPPTGKRLKRAVIDLAIKKKVLVPQFYEVEKMAPAVQLAAKIAQPQDVVLLSPGAASFGEFKDYADRGDQFCQAVKNLL